MILKPQPWAEDGIIFIQEHLSFGLFAIFQDYAGYLHLLPRIITLFSIELSELLGLGIQITPFIMNSLSVLTAVTCVTYLLSSDFNWLSSYRKRVATVLSIILIPTIFEVYGNVTNLQWWLGIFQFFVTLYVWKYKEFPSLLITLFFVLSGLSSPAIIVPTLMISLIFLLNFYREHRISKRNVIFGATTLFTAIVQVCLALLNRQLTNEYPPDAHKFLVFFPRTFFVGIFDRLVFWDFQGIVQFLLIPTSMLVGIIFFLLLSHLNTLRFSFYFFSLSYIFIFMAITFYGSTFLFSWYVDPFNDGAQRYFHVPVSILLVLFFTASIKTSISQIVYCVLSFIILINILINFRHAPYIDYNWRTAVKDYNPNANNLCNVPINPAGWNMTIPCDSSIKSQE